MTDSIWVLYQKLNLLQSVGLSCTNKKQLLRWIIFCLRCMAPGFSVWLLSELAHNSRGICQSCSHFSKAMNQKGLWCFNQNGFFSQAGSPLLSQKPGRHSNPSCSLFCSPIDSSLEAYMHTFWLSSMMDEEPGDIQSAIFFIQMSAPLPWRGDYKDGQRNPSFHAGCWLPRCLNTENSSKHRFRERIKARVDRTSDSTSY